MPPNLVSVSKASLVDASVLFSIFVTPPLHTSATLLGDHLAKRFDPDSSFSPRVLLGAVPAPASIFRTAIAAFLTSVHLPQSMLLTFTSLADLTNHFRILCLGMPFEASVLD